MQHHRERTVSKQLRETRFSRRRAHETQRRGEESAEQRDSPEGQKKTEPKGIRYSPSLVVLPRLVGVTYEASFLFSIMFDSRG